MSSRCVIVASGPSARGFIPPFGLTVIAVNGAIEWLSRADFFFTLDWSAVNQQRLRDRRAGVAYYAAYPPDRRWADPAIHWLDRAEGNRLSGRLGLSEDPAAVSVGNSAYGALGLAYTLGYRDVALVGVDANDEPRIEGGKSRPLAHLPRLFVSALPQIRVVSCGAMKGIPRVPFYEWLAQ
jgi:hypothetical protein